MPLRYEPFYDTCFVFSGGQQIGFATEKVLASVTCSWLLFLCFGGQTCWKLQMLAVLWRVSHPFGGLWDKFNVDMLC